MDPEAALRLASRLQSLCAMNKSMAFMAFDYLELGQDSDMEVT